MSHFDRAIAEALKHEGAYQCDPDDSGNWTGGKCGVGELKGTKFGIAANTYPDVDIKHLTLEEAKRIYRRDWWLGVYDEFTDGRLASKLFNHAINMGRKPAHKCLQRAINVTDDGIIGPQTIEVANSLPGDVALVAMCKEIGEYYQRIVTCRPEKQKYLKGWTARANWIPDNVG